MQTFAIPGWVWINLAVLVAAAIFVAAKLTAEKHASPAVGRAIE